jgi:predicted RNA methylase
MNKCPDDKILNPKTGRCVNKKGLIGKKILNENIKDNVKDNIKKCPDDKILNPDTSRCVNKKGIIGKKILQNSKSSIPIKEELKVKKEEATNIISNAIKIKKAKKELEKLKVKKTEISNTIKNPDLNKIIEIPEKSKKITTDEYIKIRNDINTDIGKYLPIYLPLFNMNDLLSLIGFSRQDIKRLNIFLTPSINTIELIDNSFIHNNIYGSQYKNIIYDILEPTAGTGNLIAEIITEKPEAYRIDAIEFNKQLYDIGKARFKNFNNINWYNENFFDFKPNKKYDYIFMNPPFNINVKGKKYLDIDFINEAYKLLKDDGKLCAILSNTYTYNKTSKYKIFKDFVENYAYDAKIKGGFKEDKTIMKEMQTKVKMMIVIINKQEEIKSIF